MTVTEADKKLLLRRADELEIGAEEAVLYDLPAVSIRRPSVAEARTIARVLREAAEGWRPIETAPVDGSRFLATHVKSGVVAVTWFGKTSHIPLYGWCEGEDPEDTDLWDPTHWHQLPPLLRRPPDDR